MEADLSKRYWLFEIGLHPNGGLHDIEDTFDDYAEANDALKQRSGPYNWCVLFDSEELTEKEIPRNIRMQRGSAGG